MLYIKQKWYQTGLFCGNNIAFDKTVRDYHWEDNGSDEALFHYSRAATCSLITNSCSTTW